jgi:RES domain-containing protein
MLDRYVFFQAEFEPELVERIDPASLPKNWRSYPAPRKVQGLGDAWLARAEKPVLQVPSAIVPAESNYLLNPVQSDFARITFSPAIPYRFDSRLV